MLLLWWHILLHYMPFSKQCGPVDVQLEWPGQPLCLLCRTQPVFPPSCSLFQCKMRVILLPLWNIVLFSQTFSPPICHSELSPLPAYWQNFSRQPIWEISFTSSFYSCLWWWWWCPFFVGFFKILKLGTEPSYNTATENIPVHPGGQIDLQLSLLGAGVAKN